MSQESENLTPGTWAGWSTISAYNSPSFTIWLTGLPGTGKTTLALFLKKALVTRGYNVEIIDSQTLSHWINLELQLKEELREDTSTLRLRNVHDRIGGKSKGEESNHAEASHSSHPERERAGRIASDHQAPSQ